MYAYVEFTSRVGKGENSGRDASDASSCDDTNSDMSLLSDIGILQPFIPFLE